jgi:FG-GAP-like repeat/FG-GAP repeat
MQRFSWLSERMNVGAQRRKAAARKANTRFRPQLNLLEHRELLSFSAPVAYPANGPHALVTADANGDGRSDLISLSDDGVNLGVELANANGSFGPYKSYYTGSLSDEPVTLAVADLGGGNVKAVAGAYYDEWGTPLQYVFLQDTGSGRFTPGSYTPAIGAPAPPTYSLAMADVDGNGGMDVVAGMSVNTVFVYGTKTSQTLILPFNIASRHAPPAAVQVAVADLSGDGKPDIVAATGGSVFVFLNNGNGIFGAAQTYSVGGTLGTATAVAIGDFNHDGKSDIVTANTNGTASVLFNKGTGTFGTYQSVAIGGPGISVVVGDFNRDGYLDVATAGAEMDVLLNKGDGTFAPFQNVGPAGNTIVVGDFNGDGFPDLAQIDANNVGPESGNVDVVLNTTGGAPAGPVSVSLGSITYNSTKKLYSETVTLTNTTNGTLTGPLSLGLTGLPDDVVLTDATGITNGSYYFRFLKSGKTLNKGASVTITLTFTAASQSEITFGTEVVPL